MVILNHNFRPFSIPDGVFDLKRLVSDKEYEDMLKNGKLKRNIIDPKFAGSK